MSWYVRVGACLVVGMMATMLAAAPAEPSGAAPSLSIPEGPLKVKITGIEGMVQARANADAKWEKAAEGLELTEGAEMRTGPRSAVRFMLGDDQIVTLDRLGTIQILRAAFESGKVFTDLGMKYGRTRYDIDSAAHEHEAKVHSPNTVLAVRGTQFNLLDQAPFPPKAVSLNGRVVFKDAKKTITVGGKNEGKARVDTEVAAPVLFALNQAAIHPGGEFSGRTRQENDRNRVNPIGGLEDAGPPPPPPPPPGA